MTHPALQFEQVARRLDAEQVCLATVVAIAGNQVQILRNGQIAPDQQFYACKRGEVATLAVGDRVSAIRHGSGYLVMGAVDS